MEEEKHNKKGLLFWKIQAECLRRAVTPFIMYIMMSLIMLACQAFGNAVLRVVLGVFCILCGMFFNGHLLYHCGITHYDAYLTGNLHRTNALFGIRSGGDHRTEREYRPYKGFLIGLYVGLPVVILGIVAGFSTGGEIALDFVAGWAIIPLQWMRTIGGIENISAFWSIAFVAIPVAVSGIFYIVGAQIERRRKELERERAEAVRKLAEKKK